MKWNSDSKRNSESRDSGILCNMSSKTLIEFPYLMLYEFILGFQLPLILFNTLKLTLITVTIEYDIRMGQSWRKQVHQILSNLLLGKKLMNMNSLVVIEQTFWSTIFQSSLLGLKEKVSAKSDKWGCIETEAS